MFFCSYYLKIVTLFLDEPSGIAESSVFNLFFCPYYLKSLICYFVFDLLEQSVLNHELHHH